MIVYHRHVIELGSQTTLILGAWALVIALGVAYARWRDGR